MSKNADQFFDWDGKDSFRRRLEEAMQGESSRAFAARCGLSDTVIRNYLSGKSLPSLDRLAQIAATSEKPMEWFIEGVHDAHKNSHSESFISRIPDEDVENKLRSIFELMSIDEKRKAISIFKNKGLSGLMPLVLDTGCAVHKEILAQCNTAESTESAPLLSTHDKKAG